MALELVETVEVGSGGASSISFTNIPSTGKDLVILISMRTTASGCYLSVNGSGTTSGAFRNIQGNGTGVSGDKQAAHFVIANDDSETADTFGVAKAEIYDYTATGRGKHVVCFGIGEDNNTSAYQRITNGEYSTTSAITRVDLDFATFEQYSSASLYIRS